MRQARADLRGAQYMEAQRHHSPVGAMGAVATGQLRCQTDRVGRRDKDNGFTDLLNGMVDDWTSSRGGEVSEADLDLTSGLVALISGLYNHDPDFDEHARRYVSMALGVGRPAWASAGRAVWAMGLWRHGDEDSALLQLVRAELELAEELRNPWIVRDPEGGPTGPGAASNNLGMVYTLMRMMELADPHLHRAAQISQAAYGPELRFQVLIDQFNLAEADVRWSFHAESVGRLNEARQRARTAAQNARRCAVLAREYSHPNVLQYAEALDIAARTVLDPESIQLADERKLRATVHKFDFGDDGPLLVVWTTLARVCRILGDVEATREAARRASALVGVGDHIMVAVAAREAALTEEPTDLTWRFARVLAGQSEAARRRSVSAFRSRLATAGMEQRYEEVSAEKQRLEQELLKATGDVPNPTLVGARDSLTGLPNREAFLDQVESSLQRCRVEGLLLAVACIDVDGLTAVNSDAGHAAGDDLLRWVADRLQASLRPEEVAARIGGDEFAVLLTAGQDAAAIHGWAGRINDDLNDLDAENTRPYPVSVSIGACIVSGADQVSAGEVLTTASGQLTHAKRSGRAGAQIIMLGD